MARSREDVRKNKAMQQILRGETPEKRIFVSMEDTKEKEERQNNYLDQSFIAMERQYIINDDLIVYINSMTSRILRGVPGSLSEACANLLTHTV